MPVNKKMMNAMKKHYGEEKGEKVYYALENKMKGYGKKSAKAKLGHKMSQMAASN